ncbi:aldehyde dehydrogenase family protein [Frankia sp. CNm7]|uniref:Aldehyde dehydrogenase family protein n=2 Tax=Frankia nepalensis TaxID=1836974 RepID=A0A937UPN6_9ACTN|nr:aldehyde dehydrogenase family protein [Frankia nepalensis]MBL7511075.1 aldehyde dehydrogenase family protein [Frankia nepalensis]MBL7516703.1 aldehyde dehydrogenase family protein [Frankia nepalensis]MBL7627435.1 aldehyde dehydrogenase family protein [Frankia nepalensis]
MGVQATVSELGQLINGTLVTSGQSIPVVNPSSGEEFARCPAATVEMVDTAMAAAAAALPAWSARPEAERRAVIKAMADAIGANYATIEEITALEKGASSIALEALAAPWFGNHIAEQELRVDIIEDSAERTVKVVRAPFGVVAAIIPWNAPILILAEKVFSALLVGNTIVAKPSPFTPLATLFVAKIWKDLVPPGVVNILAGDDEVGKAMVAHPTTRLISFTGSIAAGRAIAAAAAPGLKNVLLELGGNDAAIVLDDVDPKKVAQRIFDSAFTGHGQVCAAIKRVYAHESVYQGLVDELAVIAHERAATMIPVTTKPQFDRVSELVTDALDHGGKAVAGGAPAEGSGYFYPPTIMTGVGPGVRVVDEEQFGPVLPVIPFSDVEWAIEQANATEYGLCGSVWTSDIAHGEQIAARLECGTAWVNQHTEIDPKIPFGGVKSSGIGRNNGQVGLDAYAELKTVIVYKDRERV